MTFFLDLARLPYPGAQPAEAADWLRTAWPAAGPTNADTDIAGAQFKVRLREDDGGATYSLEIAADDLSV